MELDQIIASIHPIPEYSREKIKHASEEENYGKGHLLLRADKAENNIYFIKKGVVRAYYEHEEGEITFWFGTEGQPVLSMKSYVEGLKSYENIELLEDSTMYKINIKTLRSLFETDIHIANWGRKLAEKELLKIEKRLIFRELLPAKQRYDELMKNQAELIQRIPLKLIASYLGMTPVSLSRIRKQRR